MKDTSAIKDIFSTFNRLRNKVRLKSLTLFRMLLRATSANSESGTFKRVTTRATNNVIIIAAQDASKAIKTIKLQLKTQYMSSA
jgi:hypothetical protein